MLLFILVLLFVHEACASVSHITKFIQKNGEVANVSEQPDRNIQGPVKSQFNVDVFVILIAVAIVTVLRMRSRGNKAHRYSLPVVD